VSKRSGFYPRVRVDGNGKGVVSHAGGALLTDTIWVTEPLPSSRGGSWWVNGVAPRS
jgi:hypothetical protein